MAHNMIVRAKTFRAWFNANLRDRAEDIANHGADSGFYGITYTSDCVKLFDKYDDEIWEMVTDQAESLGETVPEMFASFGRQDMFSDVRSFKNLMVWFACETIAREIADKRENKRA